MNNVVWPEQHKHTLCILLQSVRKGGRCGSAWRRAQNDEDELTTGSQRFPQSRSPVQRRRAEASSRLRAHAGLARSSRGHRGERVGMNVSASFLSSTVSMVEIVEAKRGSGQWGRDGGMGEHAEIKRAAKDVEAVPGCDLWRTNVMVWCSSSALSVLEFEAGCDLWGRGGEVGDLGRGYRMTKCNKHGTLRQWRRQAV
ncbi:hypothetical protein DFH94DRAFT_683167 [Russula ochroleuca]|uniref:Uncharacterized protein n=1 Tax=Russula ochroleuca TaxID=152965 RepID=A0A9P5MSU5_9AGAM|nr:hypothetical protein DFH94DRAFT_683167 [Russula ochroleuca]